jgi:hypothetical protein
MVMDFDPDTTGIASRPFWLHWQDKGCPICRHRCRRRCLRGPLAQVPVSFVGELRRHRSEHRLQDITALLRDTA